jgi:small conductance mechanosensitive channel
MLISFRPFKVGDTVSVAGITGKVDEIELFLTHIDTFDNRRIILPNAQVFGSVIENIGYHEKRRADIAVGTGYDAQLDQVRAVLKAAAEGVNGRLEDEEVEVVLLGLGASSINWQVGVWAPTSDFLAVKQAATEAIKRALDEASIGIPFPQMELHLPDRALRA